MTDPALKEAVERAESMIVAFMAEAVAKDGQARQDDTDDAKAIRTILTALSTQSATLETMASALEWYADPISYAVTQVSEPRSAAHADGGKRARTTLNQYRQGGL